MAVIPCNNNYYRFSQVLAVICIAASPTPNSETTKLAGTSLHPEPPTGAKTSSEEEIRVYIQKLREAKNSPSGGHRVIPRINDDTKYSTADDVKSSKHAHSSAKPAAIETESSLSSSSLSPKSTKMSPESGDAQKKSSDSSSNDTTIKALNMELDAKIVLIVGVTAAGLLIVLTIIVLIACRRSGPCGRNGKKDFSLNKDLHTWDPQILRPDQKNIDAFIFGKPIPTVDEMIKQ